jgi:hypothetical protein
MVTRQNLNDALDQLQSPYVRYCVDKNYQDAYWVNNDPVDKAPRYDKRAINRSYPEYRRRIAARTIQEAQYSMSYERTNKQMKLWISVSMLTGENRLNLDQNSKEERAWMTFRDVKDPERHRSMFTGPPSIPLKDRWLDMDASDVRILM